MTRAGIKGRPPSRPGHPRFSATFVLPCSKHLFRRDGRGTRPLNDPACAARAARVTSDPVSVLTWGQLWGSHFVPLSVSLGRRPGQCMSQSPGAVRDPFCAHSPSMCAGTCLGVGRPSPCCPCPGPAVGGEGQSGLQWVGCCVQVPHP